MEKEPKGGLFGRLKQGLSKTRQGLSQRVEQIVSYYREIDDDFYEELEEILITSDVGMETSGKIIDRLKDAVKEKKPGGADAVRELLKQILTEMLEQGTLQTEQDGKKIILFVGVNGVGKTTTIGKLAYQFREQGKSVMLAAGDTFRAAATEQLIQWARRAQVPIVHHDEGADPAAVIYDALSSAKSKNIDCVLCDTAGRLHNKKNLMEELKKIHRVIKREAPDTPLEVLLVLDATTGQNALSQAREFRNAADVTGIVLTKMDGTAKGGVAFPVTALTGIPIRYIGVGEGIEDLQHFDAKAFVDALFAI